jgi:hypothetical protein
LRSNATKERERKETAQKKMKEIIDQAIDENRIISSYQEGMRKLVEQKLEAVKKWEKAVYSQTAIILSEPSLVISPELSALDLLFSSENDSSEATEVDHEELISLVDENTGARGNEEEEEHGGVAGSNNDEIVDVDDNEDEDDEDEEEEEEEEEDDENF